MIVQAEENSVIRKNKREYRVPNKTSAQRKYPACQAQRLKTIRWFCTVVATLLAVLVFYQWFSKYGTADQPLGRLLLAIGSAQASEGESVQDPLEVTSATNGVLQFVESSADGRILSYVSAEDAATASVYLDQSLQARGWQPISKEQQGLFSYAWSQTGVGTAWLFVYFQNNEDGSNAIMQLL